MANTPAAAFQPPFKRVMQSGELENVIAYTAMLNNRSLAELRTHRLPSSAFPSTARGG
jgi:hypothetical protein